MNSDYLLYPPDENPKHPLALGSQSKEHSNEMIKNAQTDVNVAQSRLKDAIEKFSGGDWADERALVAAEDNLEAAEDRLEHARRKYRWEVSEKWKEKPHITKRIVDRTLSLLLRIDWAALLRRDAPKKKTKPPQIEE